MNKKTKIRLEVRSFSSPDVEFYSWEPATNSDVFFLVEMEIGEVDVDGTDLFNIVVATPEALRSREKEESNTIRDRATFIVSDYDWLDIQRALEAIVQKCESDSWVTSIQWLQRYFKWEYEDYQMEGGK